MTKLTLCYHFCQSTSQIMCTGRKRESPDNLRSYNPRVLTNLMVKNNLKKRKKPMESHGRSRGKCKCDPFLTKGTSVQFRMVSMRSGRPICTPHRLSGVSPMLPLKQFQMLVWLHDDGPFSSKDNGAGLKSLGVGPMQEVTGKSKHTRGKKNERFLIWTRQKQCAHFW